jgi:natural product precursor
MKKKSQKLQLHRETLHNLSERNLKEVVGGATIARTCDGYTAAASCDCSLPPTWACNCG